MRPTFLLAALTPTLVLAAPTTSPKITSLKFSGSGCPNDSGSVKTSTAVLADNASFTFTQLTGDSTDNCEIHVQSTGGSQGWQVAVKEITYQGTLQLKPGTQLDTFTQIYWSDRAGDTSTLTGHITCAGPEIRDAFTLVQSTADPKFSKCTAGDGNPGILNVNFRPVVSGNDGSYDVKSAAWKLVWRQC